MKSLPKRTSRKLSKQRFAARNTTIPVQYMGRTILIAADKITFLKGEGNYTFINTNAGNKYLVSKTLKLLAEKLQTNFIRIHKSFLINSDFVIERMEDDRLLKMACGKEVTVSRRKIKEITGILDHSSLRISA